MRVSRAVLTGTAIGTILGTGYADLTVAAVAAGQRAGERDLAVKTAALLPVISWAPFFLALSIRGTAVEDQSGRLPRLAGVPANLVPATLIPAISALGYALHRRGR